MRKAHSRVTWLFSVPAILVAAGAVASGCGGDDSTPGASADAGRDVALVDQTAPPQDAFMGADAPVDAPVDAGKPSDACVPDDADLLSIQVPDAAIGDSGATAAECYQCTKDTCSSSLSACNADCSCKDTIVGLFTCLQMPNASPLTCAGGLLGAGTLGQNLGICVEIGCAAKCGLPSIIPPKDAGVDSATPPTDSGSDAGSSPVDGSADSAG